MSIDHEAAQIAAQQALRDMIDQFKVAFPFATEAFAIEDKNERRAVLIETLSELVRSAELPELQAMTAWFVVDASSDTLIRFLMWLDSQG
jgi:hypothetical protein